MEPKDYQRMIASYARELGLSAKETAELMNEIVAESRSIKRLIGKPGPKDGRSKLVKLGILLIVASPDPFTDVIGYFPLAIGLMQERRRQLNIADTYNRFQSVSAEMHKMKQEISQLKFKL